MSYYTKEIFLTTPVGNNTINFWERKEYGSDCRLRIPALIHGSLEDVRLLESGVCYEYISDKWKLISASGLDSLVYITQWDKDIYIIDNHNHAFYCRWKSYIEWKISRWSHLIHIDQHSDLWVPPSEGGVGEGNIILSRFTKDRKNSIPTLSSIATYTNEILDIASFIKPAKEIWLIGDYEIMLTEYSLLQYQLSTLNSQPSTIIDIDLDFRAPEMGIEYYYQTIKKVRQLIALPDVRCITIATSPTYIHQQRALQVLRDIID